MSILGQCPKCGHRVLHVNVEQVVGVVDGESKARCLCYSCIHCNTVLGVQMLGGVAFLQGPGVQIVRSHHERWDGGGYPDGLSGEEIPLGARIFAVADALDAITSHRPYRGAQSWRATEARGGTRRG